MGNENEAKEVNEAVEAVASKKKKGRTMTIVLLVLSGVLLAISAFTSVKWQQAEAKVAKISYEPVKTETDQFYPGRAAGDYSDTVFDTTAYLNSIDATEVQRAIYQTNEGTKQKLLFNLDSFEWTVETTVFDNGAYGYGLYTFVEAKDQITGKLYRIPSENVGTIMMDASSPFWFDRLAFDVFHNATDPNSELKAELRGYMTEADGAILEVPVLGDAVELEHAVDLRCPFYGLGIPHYDKDPVTGEVTWHDDMGPYKVEDGLDLHY